MSRSRVLLLALIVPLAGCRHDMQDQPRYKPLAESDFFADHRSARPQVEGTVARGHLRIDQARYVGKVNNADINYFPIPITLADVKRGQERFNIYCSPCHGRLGDGMGMVVQRGYRQPPSYFSPRLMTAPVGHYFDVITNGFGGMPTYASRVAPDDRWRIIAYIRALQLSMSGKASDVPADQQTQLQQHPEAVPLGPFNYPPEHPAILEGTVPESGMRSPANKAGGVGGALPGSQGPGAPASRPGTARQQQ